MLSLLPGTFSLFLAFTWETCFLTCQIHLRYLATSPDYGRQIFTESKNTPCSHHPLWRQRILLLLKLVCSSGSLICPHGCFLTTRAALSLLVVFCQHLAQAGAQELCGEQLNHLREHFQSPWHVFDTVLGTEDTSSEQNK